MSKVDQLAGRASTKAPQELDPGSTAAGVDGTRLCASCTPVIVAPAR
jgi:hypothetical protein